MTPMQNRMLRTLEDGTMRTDQGNWTMGERSCVANLIKKGWAKEVCNRLDITPAGRKLLEGACHTAGCKDRATENSRCDDCNDLAGRFEPVAARLGLDPTDNRLFQLYYEAWRAARGW